MATSVVPDLLDALVFQCATALPGVNVYDALASTGASDSTGNTGDSLFVGVDDIDSDGSVLSVSTSETPGPFGTNRPRDEVGEVVLVAESWSGDKDQQAARVGAYAIQAAVANLCRTSPNLGVSHLLWTGYGSSTEFRQDQTDSGAVARLTFRISFRARI